MERHRFFASFQATEPGDFAPKQLLLDEEESHHAVRVMRLKAGDQVEVVNGCGWLARCRILNLDPRKCLLEILHLEAGNDKLLTEIHIAIAPPKNIARLEWFLEKATEIGVSRIVPIQCQRSERVHLNITRMEKVIRAALKQSLRTYLPELAPVQAFKSYIDQQESEVKLLAYLDAQRSTAIKDVYLPRQNVTVLIGPEGDFTQEEVEQSMGKGYLPVSLGSSRLRTETAALMACAVINMINGQL